MFIYPQSSLCFRYVLHNSYLIYEFLKLLISFVELFSNIFEPFAFVPKSNNEGKYRQKENWWFKSTMPCKDGWKILQEGRSTYNELQLFTNSRSPWSFKYSKFSRILPFGLKMKIKNDTKYVLLFNIVSYILYWD